VRLYIGGSTGHSPDVPAVAALGVYCASLRVDAVLDAAALADAVTGAELRPVWERPGAGGGAHGVPSGMVAAPDMCRAPQIGMAPQWAPK